MAATYLDRILARHREVEAADNRDVELLAAQAAAMPRVRDFRAALSDPDRLSVISEVKRRSPSKGDLAIDLDPVELARSYAAGGASCLSVLTDVEFFGGSTDDLRAARGACDLPVLRKDFTIGERDVLDARIMGADCLLLIAAAMPHSDVIALHRLAMAIGIGVLVEVHDEHELEVALMAEATLIGVNQRDLVTFQVDHARAVRMAGLIPAGVVKVAESGVRGRDDAAALRDAGYDAVLVGELLVTAVDPAAAIADLIG
ncbi:MAG: indole-3-glycerol phosphate synthase TrpC [Ilumatobacteraceae bacterium]